VKGMKNIGRTIRTERKARGLSLKELAERCGVSTMTLQRIETGKTSPSVAVLAQIAHHLLKPIDFFIKDERPKIVVLRSDKHEVLLTKNMALRLIAPIGLIDDNIFVNVGEAKEGRFIDSHSEDGYSFVYLLEGGCVFEHDGVKHEINQGDALFYNAAYPHSVNAVGNHKFLSIFFKGKK
jgi:transcriptional regulator with XRE-family HTH domain